MSLVKWRGTKSCFAGRPEELPSVFTGPCEAEILLNQSQKRLFLLLNNNQKKSQALYPSPHCPLITPTSSFPTLLLKEAFKLGFSTSNIFSPFSCQMVLAKKLSFQIGRNSYVKVYKTVLEATRFPLAWNCLRSPQPILGFQETFKPSFKPPRNQY